MDGGAGIHKNVSPILLVPQGKFSFAYERPRVATGKKFLIESRHREVAGAESSG
jgi:hypothetical protein